MNPIDAQNQLADLFACDPLTALEGCVMVTPSSQSVSPIALGEFHKNIARLGSQISVDLDEKTLAHEAHSRGIEPNLVLGELLMALGHHSSAISLGELLHEEMPTDQRIKDLLIRARQRQATGRAFAAPGI